MKSQLRETTKARREVLLARKAAAVAGAAGAVDLQILAIYSDAADVMEHEAPKVDIVSGEVVLSESERPDAAGGWALRDTLASPDTAAIVASMERTDLLTQGGIDILAMGIDAAASIPEASSLDKMLGHQLALAHQSAFKLMETALQQRSTVEMARLVNASARMMSTYQQGLLALNRIHAGGRQVVTVQHVNISGGQAVVAGSLHPEGSPTNQRGLK